MENPLRKQIRSIMKDHKKRQMWYRIVTTLAVVVVFVTTYMLILPAITMENKAECGITEHKHDANCYSSHYEKEKELACTTDSLGVHKHTDACYDAEHKLICGYADFVIHEHDASCYDKDGNLVCTIPEHKLHQHTPECYQMQKQLVCTQEESVGHTHTEECYTKTQGNLICGKEEHTHGESCYDAEGNLICTLEEHTHSDECYEWNDILTCTIPESAGHTHSEACYQDVQVLICEEPAELHTHTAECYKDGVLACGKLELKEHKHSETCFTEKQVLVETLICDRVEHVHTDECYKGSSQKEEQSSVASEEVVSEEATSGQSEEVTSEDASTEENSTEEISSEELSTEEVSAEAASLEETSTEETSSQIEEASSEETSSEAETTSEEVSSEAEESSIEETSEEASTEEFSTEEVSTEEISTEEISTEEASSEEEPTEAETEEESSELPKLTGIWPQDMIAVASALVGSENKDLVEFCLNYVGVYGVSFNTDLDAWIESLQENDLYGAADEFDPNPGDVAFFDEDGDGSADYVGVVVDATFDEDGFVTEFTVVQTNDQGIVEEHVYSAGEESLMGCCLMPYIADSNDALVIPETYANFNKYVTSMVGTGTVYDKTTGNYKSKLKVDFLIPSADVKDANYSYELKYPEGIIVPDKLIGQTFILEDENKTNAGHFHFVKNEDGTYSAKINFDQDYVNNAGTTIKGHLWFEGELKKTTVTEEGKIVISGEDNVKLEIPREEIKYPDDENYKYNIGVKKEKASYNKETGKLEYTVYVSSIKGTPDVIDFSDTITVTGMTLGTPQITVNKQTMKKFSWEPEENPSKSETIPVNYAYESNTIKMELPKLPEGKEEKGHNPPYVEYERYEIKYSYDVSSMDVGTLKANNKAHVESKDSKTNEIIRDEDEKDITIENKYEIAKRGDFDSANSQIKWTITLNSQNANIAGGKLTDEMLKMIKSGTDVTITPSEGAKITREADGKITSIDFEPVSNEKNTNQYTITYYTEAKQTWKDQTVRNTVIFKPEGGEDVGDTGDVSIPGGGVTKTKDDNAVEAPDGKTAEVNWTVSLIIPDGKLPKTTIKDSMSSTHNWQQGNGEGNYLTVKQIKDWGGKYTWKNNDAIVKTGAFTEADFKLTFKTKDGKEYSYSEISALNDSSDLKFTSFNVEVLNDISCSSANKLTFSYKTTADLTQAVTGNRNNYVNKVDVDNKHDEDTYHYTYSKGEIVKTDGNGQTNTTSTPTAGELIWKIKVTTDTGEHKTLTVTDALPKGVKLKEFSVEKQSGSNDKSTYIVKPDGTISKQDGGNFENEFSINGSKYENGQLTLIIQKDSGENLPKAMSFEIVVKCEVDDAEKIEAGEKRIFTNEASAKLDDVSIGSSNQTQEWTKKDTTVAKKVVDKSGDYDNKTRRAKYSIVLNPDAKDLVEGTDKLTLVDTLESYNKTHWSDGGKLDDITVQTELIPSTVKLYYAVHNGNGGYTTGKEVTGWAWTYKEEPTSWSQDYINHIITATDIPDSTALIFKYEYLITVDVPDNNYTTVQVSVKNTATLSGTSDKGTTGEKPYIWERQAAGGGVTTDKNYVLYKVEKGNYGKAVSGAVFQLQKYLDGKYQNIDGKTFTTDQEGKITVSWDADLYEKNVLYRLVEVQAPSGYKLPDGEAPSIEFYFSDEKDNNNVLPSPIPTGAVDLSKTSHTSYLENEASQSYVLPETGGTGTYWYTMGGVLLTAGAAFLIYKKHMQKGGKRIW